MEFVRRDQVRKDEERKDSVMFSMIMKQDHETANVMLSGKDACRRGSIALP